MFGFHRNQCGVAQLITHANAPGRHGRPPRAHLERLNMTGARFGFEYLSNQDALLTDYIISISH